MNPNIGPHTNINPIPTPTPNPEKAELEDERQGLEITMKGVEDSSAAAQAILYEGGNGDLMKQ
eukprot:scaffold37933_cov18-Phaeocystis_antarctica.AAC.1